MNVILLNIAALYSNASFGGQETTHYWPMEPTNLTQISLQMKHFVTLVDAIFKYETPCEVLVAGRYPGANIALSDTWQLISDIYNNPTGYFMKRSPRA